MCHQTPYCIYSKGLLGECVPQRIQDEKRKVNYPWVHKLLRDSKNLVFVQQLPAHPIFPGEDRFKLVFQISRGWGMLIIVSIKEKDLKIITVYKIQRERI